jgi:hypothetical protein
VVVEVVVGHHLIVELMEVLAEEVMLLVLVEQELHVKVMLVEVQLQMLVEMLVLVVVEQVLLVVQEQVIADVQVIQE